MSAENVSTQDFDIFVSYSSQEKSIADAVVAAHEGAGIRCWYAPRDIAPGADWADSITKAIHDCTIMVLVFSKNANRSQRVIDEVNYAISQEKALLPFRIESHNPTGALSLHLSSRHWLDAYDPGWEAHIERLVKSVRLNLEGATETIQISGEEAPSIIGGETQKQLKKQGSLKTLGFLAGALILVSLLGYYGWNYFGKGLAPANTPTTPVESTPTEPAAIPTETEETSVVVPPEAPSYTAVLHGAIEEQGFSLDPQTGDSLELTQSLFLTLTGYDYVNAVVVPEAAESWTISPDGRIYTFRLNSDIPWVTHTLGGDTVQVTDEDGEPRYLTAADFEYAFKRMCDPENQFYLSSTNIQGCRDVMEYEDPENIPSELYDAIGVEAVSDTELIIYLEGPSGYFLTKTSHFFYSAVPAWAMGKYGEAWTNPGLMPTNGTFVIDQWVPGERIRLVRNEFLPSELTGEGNIKTIELMMVEGEDEAYELWKTGQIDYALIPQEQLSNHLDQNPDQTTQVSYLAVYFVMFKLDQSPFDNIHLRRAFSAALNRTYYVNDILQGGGIPMKHFAPPGVFGAPPLDEVGIGYDLEYARSELEIAGYPECQGLPRIAFYDFRGIAGQHGDEIASFWEEALGCPEGSIIYQGSSHVEDNEWEDWNIILIRWRGDSPDEENWVGTVLYCGESIIERSCNEIDELIVQAREEINASKRIELYRQIEESFFGQEGTFPIVPIHLWLRYIARVDWLEVNQLGTWNYSDFSNWRVDMDAKEAAREE